MRSMCRVLASALLLVAASACEKAEFEKAKPEAVVITLSTGVVSADDGTLTVHLQALDKGVPVLEQPVRVSITGATPAAEQTVTTDAATGVATATFTGLDTAGTSTVNAAAGAGAGEVTASATFEVVPGVPATISLTAADTSILAGETVDSQLTVADAAGNALAVDVSVSTDAPDALFSSGGIIEFQRAGQWTVFAEYSGLSGLSGTSSFGVTVDPAAAAQVTSELAQSAVGQQQTLDVACAQFDAFGNERSFSWTAANLDTVPAAGVIVEDATVNGLFHVSGFATYGVYTATCDDGAGNTSVDTFTVVQEAAANSVVAAADVSQIEASSGTLTVTCKEVDGFGNDVGTAFDAPANFTTTAPGVIAEPMPNTFTVTGVTVKGTFTATCDNGTDSDLETFMVVDTTAPTSDAPALSPPPAGLYAAGTVLRVTANNAADAVGLASATISLVSGPATFVSPSVIALGGVATADPFFDVRLDGVTTGTSGVLVRVQIEDTTGNVFQAADVSVTVDVAATNVVATADVSQIEASTGTLTVTCVEVDGFGNDVGTAFDAPANFTTTAPGASVAEPTANTFTISGVTVKGTYTATCDSGTDSAAETFMVVDTTAPTADTPSLNPPAGPYAAGTVLRVTAANAADAVGLASATISLVSGDATLASPSVVALGGATTAAPFFDVRLDGDTAASSAVLLRIQIEDTTGNVLQAPDVSVTVDPAGTNVVATLEGGSIEASDTLSVTCREYHATTGEATSATFAIGTEVTTDATGATILGAGNDFTISGFTAKGTFSVMCQKATESDVETFTVYDATPPVQQAYLVVEGAGPHAAGDAVTVSFDVQDVIGIATESLVVVSGPGRITSASSISEFGAADPPARTFTVELDGVTTGPSVVSVRAEARDTTGNVLVTGTLAIDVLAAGTTVTTTLDEISVESTAKAFVTCLESHAETGADTGRDFVFTEVTVVPAVPPVPGIVEVAPNRFEISGFDTKGAHSVTCAGDATAESLTVFDTTPPEITQNEVTAASQKEGVQADNRYAPGTTLTLTVSADDEIGLARIDVSVIANGTVTPSSFFPVDGADTVTAQDFTVTVDASAPTFTPITVRTQATDTTGNVRQAPDLVFTVDPAKDLDVAAGITMITVFETDDPLDGSPISVAADAAGGLYVERDAPVSAGVDEIIQITGDTTFAVVASDFVAAVDDEITGGLVYVPAGYGTPTPFNIFHTLLVSTGHVGTLDALDAPVVFSAFPNVPVDLTFGTSGGTNLYCLDLDNGSGISILRRVNTNGSITDVYPDTTALFTSAGTLTVGADNLWVPNPDGSVVRVTSLGTASTPFAFAPNDAVDSTFGSSKVLVAGGTTQTVYRATAAGVVENPVSAEFDTPIGLSVDVANNDLYILDRGDGLDGAGHPWRIYRATGY